MSKIKVGKSFIDENLTSFCGTFAPRFIENENEKFWIIISSYSDTSCRVLWNKIMPRMKKMIAYYNTRFPDKPLIYGKEGLKYQNKKDLTDTKDFFEANIIIEGEAKPYLEIHSVPAGVIRDGLSMNLLVSDEVQFFKKEDWGGITRFGASSNPTMLLTGITSNDTDNVQYFYHYLDETYVKKFNVPIQLVYKVKKLTHKTRAENALKAFEKDVLENGIESTEICVNYLMTYTSMNGKFMSEELMQKNKLLESIMYNGVCQYSNYRIAGIDFASVEDYCAIVIVDAIYNDRKQSYRYETRGIKTLNLDKRRMGDIEIAKLTVDIFKEYSVDIALCDTTGNQQNFAEKIYEKIKSSDINTFLINISLSHYKETMMGNLENLFMSSGLKLPEYSYIHSNQSWAILYTELLTIKKYLNKNTGKLQYNASKPNTDDHICALALACYCIKYLEHLIRSNKKIKFVGYEYMPRYNKFKMGIIDYYYDPNEINFTDEAILPALKWR